MRNFVEMLQKMDRCRQSLKLAGLQNSQEKVGFYTAAHDVSALNNAVQIVRQLRQQGVQIVCICILDEFAHLTTVDVKDIKIVTVSQLNPHILGISEMLMWNSYHIWPEALYKHFEAKGLRTYMIEDSDNFNARRNEAWSHIMDFYDEYILLNDDESRKTYLAVIRERMTGQLKDFYFAPEAQYMLAGYMPAAGDIVIDGGAYDGATSRDFASLGARVYAFEMDAKNYNVCVESSGDDIVFENMGLWSCRKQMHYESHGAGSGLKGTGTEIASLVDIDTYVKEKKIPRVDYIKLDVEGAELEVLRGASLTISKFKPKLAISAYHKPEDLYVLQKYIRSVRPDYQFDFRHYRIDGRDYYLDEGMRKVFLHYNLDLMVPTPWEYVLYAR